MLSELTDISSKSTRYTSGAAASSARCAIGSGAARRGAARGDI